MEIEVSPVQFLKAPLLIEVTELGITVFEQPCNNLFSDVLMMALQLSLLSNTGLLGSTTIEIKLLQP